MNTNSKIEKAPTVLVILDGWGVAPPSKGNAITLAKTPVMDRLSQVYPSTTLGATGVDVGLGANHMSGSEAGHINIGAGRIIEQDSYYINKSISDGSFFRNPAFMGAVKHVQSTGGKFHIMGLMGDTDSPHSSPQHFRALLQLAKENNIPQVFCHLFSDGRDSYPRSAFQHLEHYRQVIEEEGIGKIATLSGRYYAMDRAKNWKRMTVAYDAMVFANGEKAVSPEAAVQKFYQGKLTDEYLPPTVMLENDEPVAKIGAGDSIIFYNFRSDRARQFTKLFAANNEESILKDDMPIIDKIKKLYFVAMTDFGPDLSINTAFSGHAISSTLPMILKDLRQLYIAESEKYAHLTYFFNGGYPDPVGGEERITVPSPVVDNYVKKPEMSAGFITQKVVQYIQEDKYDFIAINFANADMVGHTGNLQATIKAVEFLDKQVGILVEAVLEREGSLIITADHGNADEMLGIFEGEEVPNSFHTKNPVPFILVGERFKGVRLADGGVLGSIAPTILDVLGVNKPEEMKQVSLIKK